VGILDDRPFTRQRKTNQPGRFLYVRRADFVVFPTTIFFRDFSAEWIGRTLNWVSKTFGWYYLLAATLYITFVVCTARAGSVKLGPEQSKPEFSLLSWAAMLFAAGIGIDLMFFSVAEPVTQYYAAAGRGGADDGGRAPGDGLDAVPLRPDGLVDVRPDGHGARIL
jgi:choline-glycine betaine transporter